MLSNGKSTKRTVEYLRKIDIIETGEGKKNENKAPTLLVSVMRPLFIIISQYSSQIRGIYNDIIVK